LKACKPRIFIVDDDKSFSRSLSRLIRSAGFEPEPIGAQDLLDRKIYTGKSCLLLDVRMPGITGIQLQKMLLERNYLIPIVFLTAHVEVQTKQDALDRGAVDYLLKPVDEEILFDAIGRALDRDSQIKGSHEDSSDPK
jgi:FixJ family two-component response regulator